MGWMGLSAAGCSAWSEVFRQAWLAPFAFLCYPGPGLRAQIPDPCLLVCMIRAKWLSHSAPSFRSAKAGAEPAVPSGGPGAPQPPSCDPVSLPVSLPGTAHIFSTLSSLLPSVRGQATEEGWSCFAVLEETRRKGLGGTFHSGQFKASTESASRTRQPS